MIEINLPASKSISNRVLLISSLCNEPSTLINCSTANDTVVLKKILSEETTSLAVNTEDAGTAFRFLLAYFANQEGRNTTLYGSNRMHERPIADLVQALQQLGAEISYVQTPGFPPVNIKGKKLKGGKVSISGSVSSQFISALCMIAPLLESGLDIEIVPPFVSKPYVDMTLSVMKSFGVKAYFKNNKIKIKYQRYHATVFTVEADWSSASFFLIAQLIRPELKLSLRGLQRKSIQGDSHMNDIIFFFGYKAKYRLNRLYLQKHDCLLMPRDDFNFSDYPDLAIPFLVFLSIEYPMGRVTGVDHLKYKESNRLEALQTELAKAGCTLIIEDKFISFLPPKLHKRPLFFKSYNDHRIVMALSLFSLLGNEVHFDNPDCVQKSFPDFWIEFNKLLTSLNSN